MSSEERKEGVSDRKGRRRYSAEFRANAIKMVTELGLTHEKVAQRLGCTTETIRRQVLSIDRSCVRYNCRKSLTRSMNFVR